MLLTTVKELVADHEKLNKQLTEVIRDLDELGYSPASKDVAKDQRHSVKILYKERGRLERLILELESLECGLQVPKSGFSPELGSFLGLEKE